jgi:NADH dehydrogenase FAD-containing subunit
VAARNLAATLAGQTLEEFDPADLGYIVPLAPGRAAGVVLGTHLRGRVPYVLHYVMCVYRSWGLANKAAALLDLLHKRERSA